CRFSLGDGRFSTIEPTLHARRHQSFHSFKRSVRMSKIGLGSKRMRGVAAGLAMAAGIAGPAMAQDTFRFGLAMPLTGSQALYGQDQVKAAEWGLAEVNKGGGINGKKVEMIVLDTQADPQLGIQMTNRLVSVEKVPAFVTAWSAVVKAVAPIA